MKYFTPQGQMGSMEQASVGGVNGVEFQKQAEDVMHLIERYKQHIKENPKPKVRPGFLRQQVPTSPPRHPEPWKHVLQDVENIFMEGVS